MHIFDSDILNTAYHNYDYSLPNHRVIVNYF